MSTPAVPSIATPVFFTEQSGPLANSLIYTAPIGGPDLVVVVHVYVTVSPLSTASFGSVMLTYTDEFGVQTYQLAHEGSGQKMGISTPLRVKEGSSIYIAVTPSASVIWSVYTAVEVVSEG